MTIAHLRAVAVVAALAAGGVAHAAPSRASFAYSGGNAVTLFVNGTTTINSTHQGWIDQNGNSNGGGTSGNYFAGICGSSDVCFGDDLDRNNWFVFDLSGLSSITSAVLQLTQPSTDGYISTNPFETYTVWDTDIAGANLGSASGFFADVGSGTSFGSVSVDASTIGNIVSVTFNGAGVSALNSAAGGLAGFGGSLNLTSTVVPEPASWAMLIAGFGLVGATMRRRRAVVA